jgi:hypothetical protein
MTSKPVARESRSVRLRDDEWVLAEAISRMNGERGAGFGLRTALKREENRINRSPQRQWLAELQLEIEAERAAGDR